MPNDTLTILNGLGDIATDYTVFEPNQVLSDAQLNSLTSYLDDQERITRIELLGVGIVGGLRVALANGNVVVSRGVGVTTNGDLLMLEYDTTYDRFRPYGAAAPRYDPFYPNNQMMQIVELVPQGYKLQPGDAGIVQSLANLPGPGKLADRVVVMLMESYRKDRDLCSGTDCDNLGLDAVNIVRLLLVSQADADKLRTDLETDSADSLALPFVDVERPEITGAIGNYAALAKLYRAACGHIHANVVKALPELDDNLHRFVAELFGTDPSGAWIATLQQIQANAPDARIQYYYDFLKDVAETWNALRDVLYDDDVVLCPPMTAFPKHLLLGSLANPRAYRTDFYPSPLTTHGGNAYEHARFLAGKLNTLIATYKSPADTEIVVTPSRLETIRLEDRAIPYYYAIDANLPSIAAAWNYRRSRRAEEKRNLGYRSKAYAAGVNAVTDPLGFQIGAYDFFRIEGHQGQDVRIVMAAIKQAIDDHDLPFCLRALALSADPGKVVIKPPFRYKELYPLHQILRKDVATLIDAAEKYNGVLHDTIDAALDVPDLLPRTIEDVSTRVVSSTHYKAVEDAIKPALAPFQAASYADYVDLAKKADSLCGYQDLVTAAGDFREAFGGVARTVLSTPFDTLMIGRSRAWVDWLDHIFDDLGKQQLLDALFDNFRKAHAGLEHFGGACRGGTFVVVHDEAGKVVADFALPYCCCEDQPRDAPAETPLPDIPLKPGKDWVKILVPPEEIVASKLKAFEDKIRGEWQKDIEIIQRAAANPVIVAMGAMGAVGAAAEAGAKFTDKLLGVLVQRVNEGMAEVQRYQEILTDPTLSRETANQAKTLHEEAQRNLATSIATATSQAASAGVDLAAAGGDGARAFSVLASAIGSIANQDVRKELGAALGQTQKQVSNAGQKAASDAIGNLLKLGGFSK